MRKSKSWHGGCSRDALIASARASKQEIKELKEKLRDKKAQLRRERAQIAKLARQERAKSSKLAA